MVTILTIAGSDPTGRAGVVADLRTFASLGVHGAVALTAVTAQDDSGVHAAAVLSPQLVVAQIDAASVVGVSAVKTGMLGDADVVSAVAEAIAGHSLGPLVVDPVLRASSGDELLAEDAWPVLLSKLLPLAALVTPNIPEVQSLLGRRIRRREEMADAAVELAGLGGCPVLLKGGHLEGAESPDLLWTPVEGGVWFEAGRLAGPRRGTGCALSAAIAAFLGRGLPLEQACREGKRTVSGLFSG